MADEVNHPAHYGGEDNPYEVIKVLRAWDLELAKGFCWGSLIKYQARAGKKGSALEDRQKAEWYATELVSIEAELAGRDSRPLTEKVPIVIPSIPGSYILDIDWNKRQYRVIKQDGGGAGGNAGTSTAGGSPGGFTSGAGGKSTMYVPGTGYVDPKEFERGAYTVGGGAIESRVQRDYHDHKHYEPCTAFCPGWAV